MHYAVIMIALVLPAACQVPPEAAELLDSASAALKQGDAKTALDLTDRALKIVPKKAGPWLLRGIINEELRNFKEAVADFTKTLELDPRIDDAYDHRGTTHFKLAKFAESVADFDSYLAKHPDKAAGHWQRGISCYYAGRFDQGRKQFEGYQTVDDNDVENAVWQFLCVARKDGVEKARAGLLKVQKDSRVGMMEVYGLFAGKLKPEDVLAAAKKAKSSVALEQQLFYAHLYLGLYYDATGEPRKALEQMELAVDHRVGHYMWEVARIHRDLLKK
jgi:lipoprotein NlpI